MISSMRLDDSSLKSKSPWSILHSVLLPLLGNNKGSERNTQRKNQFQTFSPQLWKNYHAMPQKSYHVFYSLLQSLKASENLSFSYIFRGIEAKVGPSWYFLRHFKEMWKKFVPTLPAISCLKLKIETLQQGVIFYIRNRSRKKGIR